MPNPNKPVAIPCECGGCERARENCSRCDHCGWFGRFTDTRLCSDCEAHPLVALGLTVLRLVPDATPERLAALLGVALAVERLEAQFPVIDMEFGPCGARRSEGHWDLVSGPNFEYKGAETFARMIEYALGWCESAAAVDAALAALEVCDA